MCIRDRAQTTNIILQTDFDGDAGEGNFNNNYASSTFLVGKAAEIVFSGGAYDTGKDVSADIGAG